MKNRNVIVLGALALLGWQAFGGDLLAQVPQVSPVAQKPPYSGTIFVESRIVTEADSSAFVSSVYVGRGNRRVFDRRSNEWENINAYLYNVVWNDGLTTEVVVNPEFGTAEAAAAEARKYGIIVGRLPRVLRTDVRQIWIHQGVQPFGGGNSSILVHTGQTALYERDGILEETLIHEAAHTSLDAYHAATAEWKQAQVADGNYISTYARDNPTREDIAESFLLWLAVRYFQDRISPINYNKITATIPNRLLYFDKQAFNLNPLVASPTAIATMKEETGEAAIYTLSGLFVGRLTAGEALGDWDYGHSGVYLIKQGNAMATKVIKK